MLQKKKDEIGLGYQKENRERHIMNIIMNPYGRHT